MRTAWSCVNTQYNEEFNDCFRDADPRIRELLLSQVPACFGCGICKPGLQTQILGKRFENACYNPVVRLENPDGALLELAKRLILLRKDAIALGKAPKVTYISVKKR